MRRLLFILLICTFHGSLPVHAQAPSAREYQVKAVFLFNFSHFVEWPSSAFGSAESPMTIGVLGNNPFGSYLEQAVAGETMDGRKLVIRYCSDIKEALGCQMLFINTPGRTKEVLAALSGKSILTVGDGEDFAKNGGMIQFYLANNKTRIKINLTAAKAANITISSKLLRLAEIVE